MGKFKNVDGLWSYLKSGRPYVIAEAGVNHLGSIELGERLISKAKYAGADAIKFQSYKAKTLCTKNAPRFWDWEGEEKQDGSQFDSYSSLDSFGHDEHKELRDICDAYDIDFMSTPFDFEAVEYLHELGMLAYKVASCDINNFPLLERIAQKNKIVMLSTGASIMEEIQRAVAVLEQYTSKIVIMHCNLVYPTKDQDANLRMINHIKEEFGKRYVIGLSDHTMTLNSPSIAYALGANVVERHFTVDKTLEKSADHWLSADPEELKEIIRQINNVDILMGKYDKKICTDPELRARANARRSIVAFRDIQAGEVLTLENISCKRPGYGLSPTLFGLTLGHKTTRDIKEDELLKISDIQGGLLL